jgi:hypothetical protein
MVMLAYEHTDFNRTNSMKQGRRLILSLSCAWVAFSANASFASPANAVAGVRPTWSVGDWWVVESQVYDHGDKLPGATPGWLEKEAWVFSVASTNAIDGEVCYQVSIQPKDGNRCPYWFICWFRTSDLLVMRRELRQPAATRSGRRFPMPVAQANYSKDEETPFMPSDFPNLPLAVPHFAGEMTNQYQASAFAGGPAPAPQGAARKAARSVTAKVTQAFHPDETMAPEQGPGSNVAKAANPPGAPAKVGVFVLAQSETKYERQHWNSNVPWHLYGEKWEDGLLVRKSRLLECGHAADNPFGPPAGGGR